MLDIGSSELLLIVVVAIVVIGPKDLPRALYKLGQVLGKARAMSRHFRSGIDAMIREAEMEELEKKWSAENRRIMAEHPAAEADRGADSVPADSADRPVEEGADATLSPQAANAMTPVADAQAPAAADGKTS